MLHAAGTAKTQHVAQGARKKIVQTQDSVRSLRKWSCYIQVKPAEKMIFKLGSSCRELAESAQFAAASGCRAILQTDGNSEAVNIRITCLVSCM